MGSFTFDRTGPAPAQPAISVICLNKNHARYFEDCILSVLAQDFDDFEFLVADGGSTDESLDLIRRHAFIRLLPGPDSSVSQALMNLYAAARGRYVMFTTSTDGYVSRRWFKRAHAILEQHGEISLVWGASALMNEQGDLGAIAFPRDFHRMPQGKEWFRNWINDASLERSYLPELNYCIRASVVRAIFASIAAADPIHGIDPILQIHFGFNRLGYLPHYVPCLANFGRTHANQLQHRHANASWMAAYMAGLRQYREALLAGSQRHVFRDGDGRPIGEGARADIEAVKSPAVRNGSRDGAAWLRPVRRLLRPRRS